ncbi:nuclease-related domain-containing protein [Streptomyces sp. BR1]|uniref:nuclease-related domain-containing protein n=1 Tax=Streptomyces sp. BR1 TaxID=1592323 RepID=UPI00402BCBE2
MGDLRITAWQRYGHDRLYVNLRDGTAVAYLDRTTGRLTVVRPEYRVAANEALAGYVAALPSARPPCRPLPALDAGEDLALRRPGAALRAKLVREGPGPLRRATDRLLRRDSPWDSWRKGLAGEQRVGRELRRLRSVAPGWHVLHSITLPRGVDIDHLLLGPGGVFSINTKHHDGRTVWVGDDVVKVDHGRPQPYVRKSRSEARRVRRVLEGYCDFDVPVTPVLVFVGVRRLDRAVTQLDVRVYRERDLAALAPTGGVFSGAQVERLYEVARRGSVWGEA